MASKHSEIWIRLNPSKYSCHLEKFESCFTIISQWNLPLTWLSPCPLLEHYSVKLTDSNIPHSNFNFKTNSENFAQKQKMSRNTHACRFYMPATWMNIDLNMKPTQNGYQSCLQNCQQCYIEPWQFSPNKAMFSFLLLLQCNPHHNAMIIAKHKETK